MQLLFNIASAIDATLEAQIIFAAQFSTEMNAKEFAARHIGPNTADRDEMLKAIGFSSLDELIDNVVPSDIRLQDDLDLEQGMTEKQFAEHVAVLASRNKLFKSYIGCGYYDTEVPAVVRRNVLENPGWYTAYTPYQAEVAQGRLEALLNFQTVVSDLTGLEIANASLLDEATAAAEAMIMFYNSRSRDSIKAGQTRFFVSTECFPQTLDVLTVRAARGLLAGQARRQLNTAATFLRKGQIVEDDEEHREWLTSLFGEDSATSEGEDLDLVTGPCEETIEPSAATRDAEMQGLEGESVSNRCSPLEGPGGRAPEAPNQSSQLAVRPAQIGRADA